MLNYRIGNHHYHFENTPFPEAVEKRPSVADGFYRLFDAATQLLESAKYIQADPGLSDLGRTEQLKALKPDAMDAIGLSAQTLAAGRNSLLDLEGQHNSLQSRKGLSPHELDLAAEIRTCWRALSDQQKMQMAKAANESPRDYESVLVALQASPWPLDLTGGAADLVDAATLKLATLRDPQKAESIEYLRRSIEWTERAVSQVASSVRADLSISDDDLLTHFISKNDNATLEALRFDATTISQTRVKLREMA